MQREQCAIGQTGRKAFAIERDHREVVVRGERGGAGKRVLRAQEDVGGALNRAIPVLVGEYDPTVLPRGASGTAGAVARYADADRLALFDCFGASEFQIAEQSVDFG